MRVVGSKNFSFFCFSHDSIVQIKKNTSSTQDKNTSSTTQEHQQHNSRTPAALKTRLDKSSCTRVQHDGMYMFFSLLLLGSTTFAAAASTAATSNFLAPMLTVSAHRTTANLDEDTLGVRDEDPPRYGDEAHDPPPRQEEVPTSSILAVRPTSSGGDEDLCLICLNGPCTTRPCVANNDSCWIKAHPNCVEQWRARHRHCFCCQELGEPTQKEKVVMFFKSLSKFCGGESGWSIQGRAEWEIWD